MRLSEVLATCCIHAQPRHFRPGPVSCTPPHTRPNGLFNLHMKGSSPCEQHLDSQKLFPRHPGSRLDAGLLVMSVVCLTCVCVPASWPEPASPDTVFLSLIPCTGSSNSRHPMRPVPQRNKCLLPGGQAGWGGEAAGTQLWISGGWKVHQSAKRTRGDSSCPQGEQIIISPNISKLPLLP